MTAAIEEVARWDDFNMYTAEGGELVAKHVLEAVSRTWPLGTSISTVTSWVQDAVCAEGKTTGIKYGGSEVGDTEVRETIHTCIENILS